MSTVLFLSEFTAFDKTQLPPKTIIIMKIISAHFFSYYSALQPVMNNAISTASKSNLGLEIVSSGD